MSKQLEKQNTRRPLILAPQLPLAWTVSWLAIASVAHALGRPLATGDDVQESVLLLSAVVILANMYNLVILYQRPIVNQLRDNWAILAYALVLSCSTVLAWGQPRAILLPDKLAGWQSVFLLLNCGQAGLGIYLWQRWSWTTPAGDRDRLSLWLMPAALLVTAIIFPPVLAPFGGAARLVVLANAVALGVLLYCQWRNRDRLLTPVPARLSAGYQMILGCQLAAGLFCLVLGVPLLVWRWNGEPTGAVGACVAVSILVAELTTGVLAALQRYRLQYQYGLARKHQLRYRCLGALLLAAVLVSCCLLMI